MRIRRLLSLVGCVVLAGTAAAQAQDTRQVGVTIAYPTSVGVLWPISDRVSLRPDFTYSGSSSEASSGFEASSWSIGTGVSVLFYLTEHDHVRTYFSPRFDYSRSSSRSGTSGIPIPPIDTSRWASGGSGAFGVQYKPGDKFGVFGEVGFGVSYAKLPSVTGTQGHTTGWGLRSGVGVIFYP
jgi:hypothetical protein